VLQSRQGGGEKTEEEVDRELHSRATDALRGTASDCPVRYERAAFVVARLRERETGDRK